MRALHKLSLVGVVVVVLGVIHLTQGLQCYDCVTMSGLGTKSCENGDDLKSGFLKNCTGVCGKGVMQLEKKGDKGYFRGCVPRDQFLPEEVGTCGDLKLKDNMQILRALFALLGIPREPDVPSDDAKLTRCLCNDKDGCNKSSTTSTTSAILILSSSLLGIRTLL